MKNAENDWKPKVYLGYIKIKNTCKMRLAVLSSKVLILNSRAKYWTYWVCSYGEYIMRSLAIHWFCAFRMSIQTSVKWPGLHMGPAQGRPEQANACGFNNGCWENGSKDIVSFAGKKSTTPMKQTILTLAMMYRKDFSRIISWRTESKAGYPSLLSETEGRKRKRWPFEESLKFNCAHHYANTLWIATRLPWLE